VTVKNELGAATSEPWLFVTAGDLSAPPLASTALHPSDGATVSGGDLTFSWSQAAGAETYTIYVWEVGTERGQPLAHLGDATSFTWSGGSHGASYRWQIVTANDGGETEGRGHSFVVGATIYLRGEGNDDSRIDI